MANAPSAQWSCKALRSGRPRSRNQDRVQVGWAFFSWLDEDSCNQDRYSTPEVSIGPLASVGDAIVDALASEQSSRHLHQRHAANRSHPDVLSASSCENKEVFMRALSFLFEDGVATVEDGELAQVKQAFGQKSSHDALALSLEGTAYYADRHRERLKELPRFDDSIIDEALVVGGRLRDQSGLELSADPRRQALRAERARVTRPLYDRMNIARRTIRYAFSEHSHVIRRASSRYRRERRQQQWERSASGKKASADGAAANRFRRPRLHRLLK